jgi:hypothetical protein
MNRLHLLLAPLFLLAFSGVTERRHSPFFCMSAVFPPPSSSYLGSRYTASEGGLEASAAGVELFCPYVDDSGIIDRGTSNPMMRLTVTARDSSTTGEVRMAACVQFFGVDGVSCSNQTGSGVTFAGEVTLVNNSWAVIWNSRPYDFAYLWVSLPSYSVLRGYTALQ